jgi:hypothetical protein
MGTRVRRGIWLCLVLLATACGGAIDENAQRGGAQATPGQGDGGATDGEGGTTWSALYRDFFGPAATSSCAGNATCHDSASAPGATGSHGYVCADQKGCRSSMLSEDAALVQPSDATAPEKSTLIQVLRRQTSDGVVGSMPKRSSFTFTSEQIARIETWIRNGAPDD